MQACCLFTWGEWTLWKLGAAMMYDVVQGARRLLAKTSRKTTCVLVYCGNADRTVISNGRVWRGHQYGKVQRCNNTTVQDIIIFLKKVTALARWLSFTNKR
jgi:hypothetical protein